MYRNSYTDAVMILTEKAKNEESYRKIRFMPKN